MAQHTSPIVAMPQLAPPDPAPNPSPAGLGGNQLRPLEVAECSLCGVARPLGLLVPDGGSACDGVRWYCKDVRSCTERWVAISQSQSRLAPAFQPSPFGRALAAAPLPAPAGSPADAPEEPRSIASLVP